MVTAMDVLHISFTTGIRNRGDGIALYHSSNINITNTITGQIPRSNMSYVNDTYIRNTIAMYNRDCGMSLEQSYNNHVVNTTIYNTHNGKIYIFEWFV